MLLVNALLGLLLGWAVTVLADVVPRYAITPPDNLPRRPLRTPGLWRILPFSPGDAGKPYQDALIELAGMVGFVLFGAVFPFLLLLTVIDLRYRLIPNVLVYPAVIVALLLAFAQPDFTAAALVGGGMAFGVFYLTALLQPGKLGGGDVKLAGLIGLAFGFPGMLWALLVGGSMGAIVAAYLLLAKRDIPGIPYAPFLCLGALVALQVNPFL